MKNLIKYYYDLLIYEYKKKDDKFLFTINNIEYEFVIFLGNPNTLIEIYNLLISNNIYCHEILVNKDNSIITYYENKMYLLLKKNNNNNDLIILNDIINYDRFIKIEENINWKNLWQEKIDYYEYQINQLGIKYKILRESFGYYVGLCENAIALLNYINEKKIKKHITHRRIEVEQKKENFHNPLNIIVDNITRDIAEYIKINIINEKIDDNIILNYLYYINLDQNEYILLFARLLYPSYYFDEYDKIIQDIIPEEKINLIIKKNTHYEMFLKNVYDIIKMKCNFPQIEWLESK